jgi:hypothetical protein
VSPQLKSRCAPLKGSHSFFVNGNRVFQQNRRRVQPVIATLRVVYRQDIRPDIASADKVIGAQHQGVGFFY